MTISTAQAKQLCTASELTLVKSSMRSEISKLSAGRLKQKITRARKLRDKWRDEATRQRRGTQARQQGRATDDNARSAEKAELFGEVLDRFTTQLEKVEGGGGKIGARQNPPRKSRAVQHRKTRAAARKSLEATRTELAMEASSRKTARTKSVGKTSGDAKSAKKAPMTGSTAKIQASENSPIESASPATDAKKRRTTTPQPTRAGALEAGRKTQELKVRKESQLKTRTAAKQNRIKVGGHIRTQKHLSATNKRRQARRDSK